MKSKEISKRFQDYYQQRGYTPLSGSSLLHPSVPMSFVMSAGMVQIETILDESKDLQDSSYVLTQKCFRYFDVGKVGYGDSYLSLFEMPGAFFFTNNGKSKTIESMWQLVTQILEIKPEHLWVTFFAGGKVADYYFGPDEETRQIWLSLGVAKNRLVGLGAEDNYWKQGGGINGQERYRKCGPNTEIFFDKGEQHRCSPQCCPGCKCGRFVEFANSLFVYNEIDQHTKQLRPLARPFVETVIGTERLAMILQKKSSVFEIDSIAPLLYIIRQYYRSDRVNTPTCRTSENIIADHIRALVFLIADGAPSPGKNGRKRLIKILIRRVLTHAMLLNISSLDYLKDLVQTVLSLYNFSQSQQPVWPTIRQYFCCESPRFERAVQAGLSRLRQCLKQNDDRTLSGQQIVTLEKKYGLPNELIERQLHKKGLTFHNLEYQAALQSWKKSLSAAN